MAFHSGGEGQHILMEKQDPPPAPPAPGSEGSSTTSGVSGSSTTSGVYGSTGNGSTANSGSGDSSPSVQSTQEESGLWNVTIGALWSTPIQCPNTFASGYCILPHHRAIELCATIPNCYWSVTTNADWNKRFPNAAQLGYGPLIKNDEWRSYGRPGPWTLVTGQLWSKPVQCLNTQAANSCVLPIADAIDLCLTLPECYWSTTTNTQWNHKYPKSAQLGYGPLITNAEWTTYIPRSDICGTTREAYLGGGPAILIAPIGKVFTSVVFASYGTPTGVCGNYIQNPLCTINATAYVTKECIGKSTCKLVADNALFTDPCVGTKKNLTVELAVGKAPPPEPAMKTVELAHPDSYGTKRTHSE